MQAVLDAGAADARVVADPLPATAAAVRLVAPDAAVVDTLEEALSLEPDGVVIATPSALHAEQALTALTAGFPVFCQKPLGRTAREAETVVAAARERDLLLGVDFAYRETRAGRRMRSLVRSGRLGRIYAARLAFHNAYGPDAAWYYDAALSGGGCLIDLGVHLVDLVLWLLGFPTVEGATGRLYAEGRLLEPPVDGASLGEVGASYAPGDLRARGHVETFAAATLHLDGGVSVQLECSWRLHAGRDAVIRADLYGTRAAASLRNVDGSFYDLTLDLLHATRSERVCGPPDAWPGRTLIAWARRLARGQGFDPAALHLLDVCRVVDRLYAGGARAPAGGGVP